MRNTWMFLFLIVGLMQLTGCAQVSKYAAIFPQQIYSDSSSVRPIPAPKSGKNAFTAPRAKPYTVWGKKYYPYSTAYGYSEVGTASWYGKDFHGKLTSSGSRYDMYGLSAAHKLLPLGTVVLVENLENGRRVKLVVNDRGPFVDNRIIDLSYGAARAIGSVDTGLAKVRVTAIKSPAPRLYQAKNTKHLRHSLPRRYYVQVGTYSEKTNALRARKHLLERGFSGAVVETQRKGFKVYHRVRSGEFTRLETAEKAKTYLRRYYPSCFIAG